MKAASSRNFVSMPSSFVPKGGFITTISHTFALSRTDVALAFMS